MTERIRLTEKAIERFRPKEREYTVWDTRLAGFGIRVRTTGRKSFVFHWSKAGKAHRATIGSTTLLTPDRALAICASLQADLHGDGGQPRRARKKAGETPTLLEFIMGPWKIACYDRYKASTKPFLDYALKRQLLPAFGNLGIEQIEKADIVRWFVKYSQKSPGGANKALGLLHQIMNQAIACGVVSRNPASGIRKNAGRKLNRFLSVDEIRRLNQTLDQWVSARPKNSQNADIVRLLLLTGCRRGEILNLQWREVHGDTLHLTNAKTGPRRVFLNGSAQELIARQPRNGSPWVFPSPLDSTGPRKNINAFWVAVRKRAGLEDARLHDLRHTLASQAVLQGVSLPVVARLLGHSKAVMTLRVYSHVADREVEAAAERIGGILSELTRC